MISNIISKEFFSIGNQINILWTNPESAYFTDFIRQALNPCVLIDFDKTYYGFNDIHIIICNNRLVYFDRCLELAKFFHVPLLIIDHNTKSHMITSDFSIEKTFQPLFQLAISKDIYLSWNKIHDMILNYGLEQDLIEKWKNLIFQLIKTRFVVQEKTNEIKR